MRHNRFAFAILAAVSLALAGCTSLLGAALSGLPAPSQAANATTLDERAGLAVETMYAATARAGALAFRTGIVQPSRDAAVQRDDFCRQVAAGSYEATDRGGEVMALECKLRAARDATRRAYDAGNSRSYAEASTEAVAVARELLALIRGD